MITIKLTRDQARIIEQTFLPYMIQIASLCVGNVESMSTEYLHWKMMVSLLKDVEVMFKRKLLLSANKFNFNLTDAHAIALYGLLMKKPIDAAMMYVQLLRQNICNDIHKQLLHPLDDCYDQITANGN